jgi:small subunit ribosomal protein S4
LQTIVQKKLYFKTPYHARQAIVHGHIMIDDRIINIPSYIVKVDEESKIHLIPESSFNQTLSKPESDLGSPETEDLVSETIEQDKKEETPVTQEIQKGSTG